MELFTAPLCAPFLTAALAGAQRTRIARKTVRSLFLAAVLLQTLPSPAADALKARTMAQGLDHPWAVAFLPDGRLLVTERPGRMRIVDDGRQGRRRRSRACRPWSAAGQGGLLDVALDPAIRRQRLVYLCYSEAGEAATAPRWRAAGSTNGEPAGRRAGDFRQRPKVPSSVALRLRIVFAATGTCS